MFLCCLHWAQGKSSTAKGVKSAHVSPSSTPTIGTGIGTSLTSCSGTPMLSEQAMRPPILLHGCCCSRFWAAKLPPPVPCPGPASASPPSWEQRGTSFSWRHRNSSEFPQRTLQRQPPPLARCAAEPPARCLSWQEPSRWHGDTPGQPSQLNSCPLKRTRCRRDCRRGAESTGTARRPPRPAGHGKAHRRHGTETPSTAPAAQGQAAEGTGAELTFTPSFFLLPPLLPPGERRKEISRARQGTKTRRTRISSMVPGASAAGPPGPAGGVRLLSSNHRCDPWELRGDLASTVLSYPGGSWPGA